MNKTANAQTQTGLLYGFAAYGFWGMVPLYFRAIGESPASETLAHRVFWSGVVLLILIGLLRRWDLLKRAVLSRKTMLTLLTSTSFIAVNWYVFIYGVQTQQSLQNSLGYFILPLVNVALGVLFFGERLNGTQIVAVGLACLGVVVLIVDLWIFPWIALTLAFSFCFYGVLRKKVQVDPIVGLGIETLLLSPIALGFLIYLHTQERIVFGTRGIPFDLLLALSGIITTIPLICFTESVRRLTLTTIGFMQYISPSLQFILAVAVFGEVFTTTHQVSFGLIWSALVLFMIDAIRSKRSANP